MSLSRRRVLKVAAGAAIAMRAASAAIMTEAGAKMPVFKTNNKPWQAAYDAALKTLAGNVQVMPRYNKPVLIEGSVYRGIWLECGSHESLVYRKFRPDVARDSHMTFFELQRPDGQLLANNKEARSEALR